MLFWIDLCLISAGLIAIHLVWHPQKMTVMDSVWIINALWAGPIALILYIWYGRRGRQRNYYQALSLNTLHCGAGCTLADLIVLVIGFFVTMTQPVQWVVAYVLALVIGVFFQYIAMREMDSKTPMGQLIKKAFLSDFLSLTAWQIGMLIGQLIMQHIVTADNLLAHTFNMQIAMAVGFFFAYPMNAWLVKKKIKMLMM